jgi:hypothetical protein
MGTWARPGSRWARLPHAGFAGECALCAFFLCKSCFIRDIDLRRPMAWFPGAYDLRTLSWAHVRVWGAAGRGCHTPASPGSARFARSSYVNRALFGISTADEAQRCRTRVPRAKAPKWQASTAQLTCASGCPWPGRRDRALGAAARLLQLGARQEKALRLGVRSSLPSRMNLARPAQATGQAPHHSLALNRGLGAFASHCDAVRAQHLKGISTHQRRVLYRRIVDPDPKLNGTG